MEESFLASSHSAPRAAVAEVARCATSDEDVWDLVERARGGDREAFGAIYRRTHTRIFRHARFYLSQHAAEDAVAETFLRAWVALPRYRRTRAPFAAWLHGITRHVVADARADARSVEPQEAPPDAAIDTRTAHDDRLVIAEAVAQLPDEQRRVIELKFLAGLSNEEVAAALGKSPGAVNAQQWRALASLRRILGEP